MVNNFPIEENYKNYYDAYKKIFLQQLTHRNFGKFKNYQKLKIIVISSIAGYFNGGAPCHTFGENSLINYSNKYQKNLQKKI